MWCVMPTTAAKNSGAVTIDRIDLRCGDVKRAPVTQDDDSFVLCLATVTDLLQSRSGDVG